jgi:hypothetical protein
VTPFEHVFSSVFELNAGGRAEIADCARDKNLAWI